MKKKISVLLVLCFIISSFSFSATADFSDDIISTEDFGNLSAENTVEYVPNEIVLITNYLVDLSQYEGNGPFDFNGVSITDIEPLFSATTKEEIAERIEKMGYTFSYKVTISSTITVESAVDILNNSDYIKCAEPNYIIELEPEVYNNSHTNSEGNMNTTSTSIEQWAHTYLQMDAVWNAGFTGSYNVRVAILDVGFVQTDELERNLNMSLAYDATDGDTNVTTTITHGNRVAGIIGADYNDGGVSGICRAVTMIPIKISPDSNSDGSTTIGIIEDAVEDALERNADIINLSFTLSQNSTVLRESINESKVLLVTAAGNSNDDMAEASDSVGKRHDDPYWIVVGASTQNETKYPTSNYSSRYCDLFAPGENIITTGISGTAIGNQTSMATPHVTAACALIMSDATHLGPSQVKDYVMSTVKEIEGFDEYCVSEGILSIMDAVNAIYGEYRGIYGSFTKGDLNNDGYVTSFDETLANAIVSGSLTTPSQMQIEAGDINQNGEIDSQDIMLIGLYVRRRLYFAPFY